MSKEIRVLHAFYMDEYKLLVWFTDGYNRIVDFGNFIQSADGFLAKYKKEKNFKSFKIKDGNIIWGRHWDLIFPVEQLYKGIIE